jgi:small multidrug resistance pump
MSTTLSMPYLYLCLAILTEVAATALLKSSDGMSKPLPSLLLLTGYGIAFWALSVAIQSIPVGVAYALWSGIGIAMITLIGWYFYDQKLNIVALIGLVLIGSGTIILSLSDLISNPIH